MRLTTPQALCEPRKCGNAALAQQLQQVLIPVLVRLRIFHTLQLYVREAIPFSHLTHKILINVKQFHKFCKIYSYPLPSVSIQRPVIAKAAVILCKTKEI
jgi:hypothetical protein